MTKYYKEKDVTSPNFVDDKDLARKKTLKQTLFNFIAHPMIKLLFNPGQQAELSLKLIPTVKVDTSKGPLFFHCPNSKTAREPNYRFCAEPETISWIDSFLPGETFWDIGANIGFYTMYAAISGASEVFGFEPVYSNNFMVNKNIEINKLSGVAKSFNFAFGERTSVSHISLANSQFGTIAVASEQSSNPMVNRHDHDNHQQGILSFSIDNFREIFSLTAPNHMKIDVDGAELGILKGATNTLKDTKLKSLQVEMNVFFEKDCKEMLDQICKAGFVLSNKDAFDKAMCKIQELINKKPDRYAHVVDNFSLAQTGLRDFHFDLRFDRP